MQTNFVLTLTGPDRVGIVDELTKLMLDCGGNVETSRMARLGGEFAVLMLVSMPPDSSSLAEAGLKAFAADGYKVTAKQAERSHAETHPGWTPYRIEVQGADHEGIIHEVARYLSQRGISIETMDSESAPASTSGVTLFSMTAEVVVPPGLDGSGWEIGLEELGSRLNLDISVDAS